MRKLRLWFTVAFLLQFLMACFPGDIGDPTVSPDHLTISPSGGEYIVRIVSVSSNKRYAFWIYERLYLMKNCNSFSDGEDSLAKVDRFSDGGFKVYNDWISFSVPKGREIIRVKVTANHTGKERAEVFSALGGHSAFMLWVCQAPLSSGE